MSNNLNDAIVRGELALDSSILIEMLSGSEIGSSLTNALLREEINAHSSFVNLAEAEYILCRKIGHDVTRKAVEALVNSGYVAIEDGPVIHAAAAELKCERSISLAECYVFAVAKMTSSRPVFLFRDEELVKEITRKPFETDPVFLT